MDSKDNKLAVKKEQKMFYVIDGYKYEVPYNFTDVYFNQQ